jgi:hypothetical protein
MSVQVLLNQGVARNLLLGPNWHCDCNYPQARGSSMYDSTHVASAGEPFPVDQEMAEMSLLLPRAQAMGLIDAAKIQGVTVAQLMRRLVARAIAELAPRASLNPR